MSPKESRHVFISVLCSHLALEMTMVSDLCLGLEADGMSFLLPVFFLTAWGGFGTLFWFLVGMRLRGGVPYVLFTQLLISDCRWTSHPLSQHLGAGLWCICGRGSCFSSAQSGSLPWELASPVFCFWSFAIGSTSCLPSWEILPPAGSTAEAKFISSSGVLSHRDSNTDWYVTTKKPFGSSCPQMPFETCCFSITRYDSLSTVNTGDLISVLVTW